MLFSGINNNNMVATTQKPKLTLASLIRDYAVYNLWANKTLTDWLRTKPEETLSREVPSSFPGIKPTISHITSTQRFWLSVLQRDYTTLTNTSEKDSLEDIFDDFVDQSLEFSNYVESLTENQLQDEVELITPWFESNQPRFEYIHHCMNHSTYHRGQLITIGRALGFTDAPMTDYNFYLLNAR
jgi:uncharacterized damage-inducible protein DinB